MIHSRITGLSNVTYCDNESEKVYSELIKLNTRLTEQSNRLNDCRIQNNRVKWLLDLLKR